MYAFNSSPKQRQKLEDIAVEVGRAGGNGVISLVVKSQRGKLALQRYAFTLLVKQTVLTGSEVDEMVCECSLYSGIRLKGNV